MPNDSSDRQDCDGLTPIHRRIHCTAAEDAVESVDELEQIAVDHLLDTLSEVALAIARRRENEDK